MCVEFLCGRKPKVEEDLRRNPSTPHRHLGTVPRPEQSKLGDSSKKPEKDSDSPSRFNDGLRRSSSKQKSTSELPKLGDSSKKPPEVSNHHDKVSYSPHQFSDGEYKLHTPSEKTQDFGFDAKDVTGIPHVDRSNGYESCSPSKKTLESRFDAANFDSSDANEGYKSYEPAKRTSKKTPDASDSEGKITCDSPLSFGVGRESHASNFSASIKNGGTELRTPSKNMPRVSDSNRNITSDSRCGVMGEGSESLALQNIIGYVAGPAEPNDESKYGFDTRNQIEPPFCSYADKKYGSPNKGRRK